MAEPDAGHPVPAGLIANEEQISPVVGGACFAPFLSAQPCGSACALTHHGPEHHLHLLSLGLGEYAPLLMPAQPTSCCAAFAFGIGE